MPLHENVKSEFIQKYIFYIKPVIFRFVQKTFLRLYFKQKVYLPE